MPSNFQETLLGYIFYKGYDGITKGVCMICPFDRGESPELNIWCFGLFIFILVWIVFVPVAITARLEKIIKLLQDKDNK